MKRLISKIALFSVALVCVWPTIASAACGATTYTWTGQLATTAWSNNANWLPAGQPNANTENAIIEAGETIPLWPNNNFTLACFEMISGSFNATPGAAVAMTISGDYFKNPNPGSLTTNTNFTLTMNGAVDQTLENVDPINRLTINSSGVVTLTKAFTVSTAFTLGAASGTVRIEKGLTLAMTTATTIPTSATIEVMPGATLIAMGNLTVNGVLKINEGGTVRMANTRTLAIGATGTLQMVGVPGNTAVLDALAEGSTYNLNVAGSVNANYFTISRTTTNGLNVTGTVQNLLNGEFHYTASAGRAVTLNTAVTIPNANIGGLGFFDDLAYANTKNIDATSYTGTAFTINDYYGLGGTANETDPSNKITWGTAAGVSLTITNRTALGVPAATIAKGSAATHFATFGFALSSAASTDITSLTFTIDGTNLATDVNYLQVMNDTTANCAYNAGFDLQIGSNITVTGSPARATITIPTSTVTINGPTQKCVHVLLATNANAQTNATVSVRIERSGDVSNSLAYTFNPAGGPPVSAGLSRITGTAQKRWNGSQGVVATAQNWNTNANDWTSAGAPATTDDCQIGAAYAYLRTNGNRTCTNLNLTAGGQLDFNSTADIFTVLGSLVVSAGYNFSLATSSTFNFGSATGSQSIVAATALPGNVTINNSSASGEVQVNSDVTISGALTVTTGTLRVTNGYTLTVLGNVTVNGGNLVVEPNATLNLGDGRTLTVNSGATLTLVGDSTQPAKFTCTGVTTGCAISIAGTGTISAQYYSISRLAVAGLDIASGATIDATNHLQNGSFNYPIGTNPVMLTLNRQVPTNTMATMVFDTAGSSATGAKSIVTTAGAGTLTVSNYTGDLTNCCTTAPTYVVSWVGPTNTLKLTLQTAAPGTIATGSTLNAGKFGFQQTQAGAFADADITSIKFTMEGTARAADISSSRLYYDSACSGSGGTQVGTNQVFVGSPPTATFSGLSGATVPFHLTTPPMRCFYLEVDVAGGATVGATMAFKIAKQADVVNSQTYAFNQGFAPSVSGGSATLTGLTVTWDGSSSTAWATAANWTPAVVPTNAYHCIINNRTNDPIISTVAGGICKSMTIGNGILTINTTRNLDLYGSLKNTGTLTQSGTATLTFRDTGSPTNQTIESSSALTRVTFNKTLGGYVYIGNQNLTINSLTMPVGSNFIFNVRDGDTLTLATGATISAGEFQVDGGGTVAVAAGQTFTVAGGTYRTEGTNDGYPQDTSTKGKMTVSGTGTYTFTATSGNVDLTGFLFDYIDVNGVQIGGTTNLLHLDGGQLTNLSNTYGSVRAFQFNTTGTLPATADSVGWNWGPNNTPPGHAVAYLLARSTGCASQTVSFTNWFGDFFYAVDFPVPSTKVSATSCTINIAASASPVGLTELKATGYDSGVVVDWTTGLEHLHRGFNVYRSIAPDTGFTQINPALIRNSVAGSSVHGKYRFFDRSATNGVTYYYRLEDIALNGIRTFRGPVSATPFAFLGPEPGTDAGTVVGSDALAEDVAAPDPADGAPVVIAPGVTQLARTDHSLRLKIQIPTLTLSPSALAPYQDLALSGYSGSLTVGEPSLPERTILLSIPNSESASLTIVSSQSAGQTNVAVAPAREWIESNGNLVPGPLAPNAEAYARDQLLPLSPLSLGSIQANRGGFLLPLTVTPVRHNAVAQTLEVYSEIVVDIFLSGSAPWNAGAPQTEAGPWGYEGGLLIHIKKAGLYELAFDALAAQGLDGPLRGAHGDKLRLYSKLGELPLDRGDLSPSFGPGDVLRFYAPYFDSPSATRNTLVLVADAVAGATMRSESAAPSATLSPQASFTTRVTVKDPTYAYFGFPIGVDQEHIYSTQIVNPPSVPGEDRARYDVTLNQVASTGTVRLKVFVKGAPGFQVKNPRHRLKVFLNGSVSADGDQTFQSNEPQVYAFSIPTEKFVEGRNSIEFRAAGTPVAGDTDTIGIEKFEVEYPHAWRVSEGVADILHYYADTTLTFDWYGSNPVAAYDVSSATDVAKLTDVEALANGGDQTLSLNAGAARRLILTETANYLLPHGMELNPGSQLLNPQQGADALFIGPRSLLGAIAPLAELRTTQGFRVKQIPLEQVILEFGQGVASPQAIKAFLNFADQQWQKPSPRYLIIVGDGTYDPKNQLGNGTFPTFPVYFSPGSFLDFGDDHYYAQLDENSLAPSLSVGRIPGNRANQISNYVDKVLAYEAGDRRPSGEEAKRLLFFSDSDQLGGEKFSERSASLKSLVESNDPSLKISHVQRSADDAALKTSIVQGFESGASLIHYMGHGAENLWASTAVFKATDAAALVNTKLPVVVAMNCLNGYYYDAARSFEGMADTLLFNAKGGAVAVWASTSLTSPDVQSGLQNALYEVLATKSGIRLGDALRLAKIQGGLSAGTEEVVRSWTLLGDPMVQLKLPTPAVTSSAETTSAPALDSAAPATSSGSCLAIHSPGPTQPNPWAAAVELFILLMGLAIGRRAQAK